MDLAYVVNQLWRLRIWVAVAACIALVIGLSSAYQLSFFPPSMKDKALDLGAAKTQILVDSPESSLPNLDSDVSRLTVRASLFAAYAFTAPAKLEIAREANMPPAQIAFDTGSGNEANAAAGGTGTPAAGAENTEARANELVEEAGGYRVRINSASGLPVITILTQAPNGKEAIRLADATAQGLTRAVNRLQEGQEIPEQSRATLTQLGRATGGDVSTQTNMRTAVLTFIVAFVLLTVLVMVISNIWQSWQGTRAKLENSAPDMPLDPFGNRAQANGSAEDSAQGPPGDRDAELVNRP